MNYPYEFTFGGTLATLQLTFCDQYTVSFFLTQTVY